MTASEAATKWNISHRRVITLCSEERITGVATLGNMYIIPIDAEKPVDARTTRYETAVKAKPFLKWAGGKGQLLDTLRSYYPEELGTGITHYYEPMVGGGAVLFDILANYNMKNVVINDSNEELMNVYLQIRDNISDFVILLEQFEKEYLSLTEESQKEYYYSKRDLYNQTELNDSTRLLKGALFAFLNKTCFNGLYRVNKKGEFNVPIGSYKNPLICDANNLMNVSKCLQNVEILNSNYNEIKISPYGKSFLYFDPPYRPLSKTSDFTAYTKAEFNDDNQRELAEYIKKIASKGAKVLASNSDPKNTNPDDDFFDELYSPLTIERVTAKRAISGKGSSRGPVSEILVRSY
ncbi:MAG: DNA adenine methylase [Eubacterium sp.]|nr:DNA adenine methylase [Eubacterium sp.]